ncbi:hypothetical protein MSG28_012534 [Choristoneura fumiferana]|uniref:Uncharacterized protein n=1 Tax=Choristoneura fumiferana TaxID=7141 RepID=A0ACC0KEJ9_CHOFU|nr:hypothetical protein MSG28_012534 [Choristoneura fumiferana]
MPGAGAGRSSGKRLKAARAPADSQGHEFADLRDNREQRATFNLNKGRWWSFDSNGFRWRKAKKLGRLKVEMLEMLESCNAQTIAVTFV